MINSVNYKCERLLRDLANDITLNRKNNIKTDDVIIKHLKFENLNKIRNFWSSMDNIKEAEYAKEFFLNTINKKYDIAENRIRVYGILNIIYAQKKAILILADLAKDPKINEHKKMFQKCKILELRNKVASHTLDFKENNKESVQTLNASLWEQNIYISSSNNPLIEYNINDLIIEFNIKSSDVMLNITRKFVKTWLKNGGNKKTIYELRLDNIELKS